MSSRYQFLPWLPVGIAVVLFLVLAYGLGLVLWKNLQVAPWAETAAEGRRHFHMKNTTRLSGTADEVRSQVWRAVYLEERADGGASGDSWTEAVRTLVRKRSSPQHVVILPNDDDSLPWALPGAYWAVASGSPAVFIDRDQVGPEAQRLLQEHGLPAYVVVPTDIISDEVLAQIGTIVPVRRIAGDNLAEHAVVLAEYRDPATGFGWGRTYDARNGYFHYVVAASSEAHAALAALPLAVSNQAALLYAGDDGSLPAATDRYAWPQRADWFVTPAEGPFRHFFLVGDHISYAAQSRLDHALEKGPYESRGPTALGPMEGLMIVLIVLGWASAIFVFLHGWRLLPEVPLGMRIAWTFTALLVPVLGVILYLAAYRRPRMEAGGEQPKFLRPASIQSAAATAMSFGYGAPLMIVIGYAFVSFGLPLFYGPWADGVEFLLGAGMVLMMLAMWAGAILVAWLAVQLPMHAAMMPAMPRRQLAWRTLLVTTLSMTAVSLGMMTMAWWMQMFKINMMPKDDDILWFGAMWLASLIGFLVAWPLNYPMVRSQLKMGTV